MVHRCHSPNSGRFRLNRRNRLVGHGPLSYHRVYCGVKGAVRPMRISGQILVIAALSLALTSCGRVRDFLNTDNNAQPSEAARIQQQNTPTEELRNRETIWDLFANVDDPNTTLEVNRYIWNATLDVLDFLPVQAVDPFSGIIVYGFGTPPGTGRAYAGTVYIQDPALDARSLRVALRTRSGPISREATREIEDAILTRARQLRIQDTGL